MNVNYLTSESIKALLPLIEKKEALLKQVAEIDARIAKSSPAEAASTPTTPSVASKPAEASVAKKTAPAAKTKAAPVKKAQAPKKAKGSRKGSRPGALKDRILPLLDSAGPSGLRIIEIAEKLGVPRINVSVWISTTGKPLVSKVEPGRYAAKAFGAAAAPASAAKPKKSLAVKKSPASKAKK